MKLFFAVMAVLFLAVSPLRADEAETKMTAPPQAAPAPAETEQILIRSGGVSHAFTVELALTPEEKEQGLMFRTQLADDAGMLFSFAGEGERAFWMRNTPLPLDMIFIRKDGTIGHIHHSARPYDLNPIRSQGPAIAVLEIRGGIAEKLGIKPGDIVYNRRFFGNELPQ